MGLSSGKKCSIFSSNCWLWKCILHFSCYLYHLVTWFYQIWRALTWGYQIVIFSFFGNTANWQWAPAIWAVQAISPFTGPLTACRVTASWLPVHRLPGCIIIAFLLASVIHEGSHYKWVTILLECSSTKKKRFPGQSSPSSHRDLRFQIAVHFSFPFICLVSPHSVVLPSAL